MSNSESGVKLLSMEQQFTLRKYQAQVKGVSREELEDLFLEVMRQKMAQENVFKDLMKQA
ncbi:MAG: photosystem I reaction center subunit XII [Synechococcales cyanobacterium RM1_1_8]|nr:photosystem I reaction center subunit XII [Synechococcales cyanobacterium RM1_1_8]